jgi:isoleucyl-tRNA synthetase
MSSLPPALNFAETEEVICKKWAEEDSFQQQNKLSLERGDEVRWLHDVATRFRAGC